MSLSWQNWTSVAQGSSTPGAPVAAVPWGDSVALFVADPAGGIYGIKAEQGFGWQLVPGRSTTPGGHVTAIGSGNRFTLFMADSNGEIFKTSGLPYQGWDPWTSVSEGSSVAGAPVAAVAWENSFALFIANPVGDVYAIKAEPGFGWELVPGCSTTPGGHVTAVGSGNRFTLFMADVNGEIFKTSGLPYQGWDPWTSVSEGSSIPGAPVAAVPWDNSFALFVADPGGGVYAIKAEPGFGWELVPGRSTALGGMVTALRWNQPLASLSSFLLFMVDVDGQILTTAGHPYQGWKPWTSPSEGASTPGAPVTAVPSPAYGLNFAIVIADSSGGIYKTSPALPPTPTGLRLISLSAGISPGITGARLGWNAVVIAPDSVYRIGYRITFYDAASPGSGGATTSSWTNEVFISLLDGHTYNIHVQSAYFASNVEVSNARSIQSERIVVSIPIGPPRPASLVANVVANPTNITNYALSITGSDFGRGEHVLLSVVWSIGDSESLFPFHPVVTDSLIGGFTASFTGFTGSGLCPISVPFGQPQPPQRFQVTARGITSNKTASAMAGPFVCPGPF